MMMTLNSEALEAAKRSRDALMDLEHQAERARVDYHHTIRRLQVEGGSLREIADALGLSHQRVHQIVEARDGRESRGPGQRPHVPGPFGPRGPGRGGPRHHHGHDESHGPGAPFDPSALTRLRRRMQRLVEFERFTGEARGAVLAAVESAEHLGHSRVGSEHLLIGVAAGGADDPAATALRDAGITHEAVTEAVAHRLVPGSPGPGRRRPFTPAARRVLEASLAHARTRRDDHIDAAHVLLALMADEGDAADVVRGLGGDPQAIATSLAATGDGGSAG